MVWKKVSNSDAGDSSHFGGDDIDKISETFNAGTQTDPINVKDENLYVVDPSDTSKKVRFDAGGVTSSNTRVITLPDADITVASTTAASTSVAGLMSAADKTKLDAIEASATADQTNAQIVAAVEAGTDSNTFTDADHSKLNAIEASATADQTDAQIRTAVEAATDSNVFTDADHSKLNAIEASADVTDATNVDAAGALMLSDTTTAGLGIVIDEDAMGSNSATKVPTQQSVVAYVASKIASSVTLKGNYDASSDSPSLDDGSPIAGILAGDHYVVSVAGTFFTEVLQAGDSLISKQDSPTTLSHWITVNNNMVTPVVTAGIAADAVDGSKIADDSIDSEHIVDGSVDLAHMSVNSIDSDQYVDGSIDLAHMSANSVDSDQYVDASIDLAHLAADSVDGSKIADNAINSEHYTDGSIDRVHLEADIIDGTKLADNAVNSEHYTDGSIDNAHIADDAINSEHYADGSIDRAHLSDDIIDSGKIATNVVLRGTTTAQSGIDCAGSNIDNVQNLIHDIETSGTDINFAEDDLQTIAISGNTTFSTAGRATGKSKVLRISADGTDRVCTFPSGIRWLGTAPDSNTYTVTANKYAIVTFTCFDANESGMLGVFALEE